MLRRDLLWGLDPVRFAREALGFHPDSSQAQVLRSTQAAPPAELHPAVGQKYDRCRTGSPSGAILLK
jgi:hypothetical protein